MPIVSAELVVDLRQHDSAQDAERALYLAFRRLKRRARRYFGRFEYLTFVEISQRGWPRLLLLARGADVPTSWLSQNWKECGGTRITNVGVLRSLRDAIDALRPYDFVDNIRRTSAKGRRNTRFSARFFENLLEDLQITPEDTAYWSEYETKFARVRWIAVTARMWRWPSLFLEAAGLLKAKARPRK